MVLLSIFLILFGYLAFGLVRTQICAKGLSDLDWDDLVAKLEPVESSMIATAANGHLNPRRREPDIALEKLWDAIGGAAGLSRMRANSDVLVALATYAQRWNQDQGVAVAEQMQRDGMALKRAVVGIGLGMTCGYGKQRVPSYLNEAVCSYHLMCQRLLALYDVSHSGLYSRLASAV